MFQNMTVKIAWVYTFAHHWEEKNGFYYFYVFHSFPEWYWNLFVDFWLFFVCVCVCVCVCIQSNTDYFENVYEDV